MPEQTNNGTTPRLNQSFGRRRGKPLRVTKAGLMESLLPKLLIELPQGALNPTQLFGNLELKATDKICTPAWCADAPERPRGGDSAAELGKTGHAAGLAGGGESVAELKEYALEIGFGGGEHLAHQASLYPDVGFIGCEPYLNGVAGLLKHIDDEKLDNIRIYADDARLLLDKLPDASISKVFILYPDPWPKIRHKKRRLIATPLLNQLARVMKQGGELRIATDDDDYCTWILEHLLPHHAFTWTANTSADWLTPPEDWVTTRYEQKKAVNRGLIPSYLNFVRS